MEKEWSEISEKPGMDMAEGEVLDLRLDKDNFGESNYFECIYKKTASLFAISASIGAYTGGADEILIERFNPLEILWELHTRSLTTFLSFWKWSKAKNQNSHLKLCRTCT